MIDFEDVINRYKTRGVLVDTNLLLLLLIGRFDVGQITTFQRTRRFFSQEDYVLLEMIVQGFRSIITTPNILTEISNFVDRGQKFKGDFLQFFDRQIHLLTELYVPSKSAAAADGFRSVGLTDSVILLAAQSNYLVLTIDVKLAIHLNTHGVDAINFNHLREYYLD